MRSTWLALALVACGNDPTPGGQAQVLAPPAPGQGFQIAIPDFSVAPGEERQNCFFLSFPGNPGDTTWINRFVVSQNQGTHHMNIFRVKTRQKLWGNPGDVVSNGECFNSGNWADWPLVINSQDGKRVFDWTLPEDVGEKFEGGELLMLQTHYVNATNQYPPTGFGRVFVNFYSVPTAPKNELGTFFATNQHIRVCPGQVNAVYEARCMFPSSGIKIVAANGHFHSRGVEFKMFPVDPHGNVGDLFYDSHDWNDPPMMRDLSVDIPMNGGIDWSCTFSAPPDICGDPNDQCCFTFGPHNQTQEHCNVFAYYYPKTADINCF